MGDRSNVFIQQRKVDDEWIGVGYYSHWGGMDMQSHAIDAAKASTDRLGDEAYFARRMLHLLMNATADPDSATGAGIWVDMPCDNEYRVLVVNAQTGKVWLCDESAFRQDAPDWAHTLDQVNNYSDVALVTQRKEVR